MKIVIDTNVWISFLIGRILGGLEEKLVSRKIQILTSDEQIHEIIRVVTRPKFAQYFSREKVFEMLALITRLSETVVIEKRVFDCPDKKDNFILEIAVNGGAELIVTGDKDLLNMNPYQGIKVVNYKDFVGL
ncbi:MAG: putative toxin-antitoxin system toxin component, PIN family [Candidatus Wallbacteria bacterium]|nr:putative toxin-antitoxin system toxin component, PIN family [Candidatus Wallbacteria bacterium]